MSAECYPMTVLPHLTKLYADYLAMSDLSPDAPVRRWYGSDPSSRAWMGRDVAVSHAEPLADALRRQVEGFGAGPSVFANIDKLRTGARVVVTGQQVGLLGGPLYTLLKAATAVARASEATAFTGVNHVPVFWLATEDHDLAEVDQVILPDKHALHTLRLGLKNTGGEVGLVTLGPEIEHLLDKADELLGYAPICELLRECYAVGSTLGLAMGRLLTRLFAAHGLIVVDASGRAFHALGAAPLRMAIEQGEELEAALLARTAELEAAGYQVQVLVKTGASLLFLIDKETGARTALKRVADRLWKAGSKSYSSDELLEILEIEPERLSPNALLRPIFQDALLPTAAYVGGPAEVAYFAQSAVLYERLLGRVTPVLPRFSATLIEPLVTAAMAHQEVSLKDLIDARTVDAVTQRLGARAMPVKGKRRLAAAGNAMHDELSALTDYLASMDESLGRSANVSANKMRYQMNRLRRMAATFEVQKDASLKKHAEAWMLSLFPDGQSQERVIAGVWFLARGGLGLVDRLVAEAADMCLGHSIVRL